MTDIQILEEVKKISRLSFNSLAKELGLKSPQIFYDIKAGKCGISKDLASKIHAKFLNISYSWLLTGEGSPLIKEEQIKEQDSMLVALQMLEDQLKVKDEQIARLHQLLEMQLKGAAHVDVASVDAG